MDSKVIIDADIEVNTSSYILYILDRLVLHSEFYPTNDDFYEENYITKYKFDELEIINGILYRLEDSTWHIHLVCRGKLSILSNLLELINPYVLDNKTWAYLQTDNRFPIMYNEGVIYTPTIKNEMKVVYEC